jgi:hypothetical protein
MLPVTPPVQRPVVPLHSRNQSGKDAVLLQKYGYNSRPLPQRFLQFFFGPKTPAPTGGPADQFGQTTVAFLEGDLSRLDYALTLAEYPKNASADPFHYKAPGAGMLNRR